MPTQDSPAAEAGSERLAGRHSGDRTRSRGSGHAIVVPPVVAGHLPCRLADLRTAGRRLRRLPAVPWPGPGQAACPGPPDAGPRSYGWLLIPPRAGRLVEIREPAGIPFIKDFIVKTPVPRQFDGAHGSTDSVVAFVVEGADSQDVERNLAACIDLADDLVRWERSK